MHTHSRFHRGFTLIEVMTVVVILLVLAALAVTWRVYGMGRARLNNAVFDVAALIDTARLRAISRGTPQYVFFHQTPDNRVRLHTVERPDALPSIPDWNALDLSQGIDFALRYERALPPPAVGTEEVLAQERDRLVLSVGTGLDSGGLSFLDLDSPRIQRPLPAPFQAIALTSAFSDGDPNIPTEELLAGCSFCVDAGDSAYGVLRFNTNGTMEVMTGDAPTGGVIAFASSGQAEDAFAPRLLTVSAPAGAVTVF